MLLVLVVLATALVVGRLAGGTLTGLGSMRIRHAWLAAVAVALQGAGALAGGPLTAVGLGASALALGALLALNRGLRGTGLVALGLLSNALVVGANGAMPVSFLAAERAGVDVGHLSLGSDGRHELLGPDTRLPLLADVVPVPLPLRPEVHSPGDLGVAAGLAQLVVVGMRTGRPRREGPARRDERLDAEAD